MKCAFVGIMGSYSLDTFICAGDLGAVPRIRSTVHLWHIPFFFLGLVQLYFFQFFFLQLFFLVLERFPLLLLRFNLILFLLYFSER